MKVKVDTLGDINTEALGGCCSSLLLDLAEGKTKEP